MTDTAKMDVIKAMTGTAEADEVLLAYLSLAGDKILNRLYPFRDEDVEVPRKYQMLQCEIAVYLLNKRGAEGQTGHSENGISRSYGSADVPDEMLADVTPYIGVM